MKRTIQKPSGYLVNRILLLGAGNLLYALLSLWFALYINLQKFPVWILALLLPGIIALAWALWHFGVKPFRRGEHLLHLFGSGYTLQSVNELKPPYSKGMTEAVGKLRELMDSDQLLSVSKRQAQYLALQNQINPHFLYNTLEGIRSEALLAGLDGVAEMTEALANFFRYTISNVENLVSVEEELGNTETYFRIQQYRFGERLQLRVEMDDSDREAILSCRIPKLTLQPIVENSIIHGIERKVGQGLLRIRLERTEKRLIILVSDDGVGMDIKTLSQQQKQLDRGSFEDARMHHEKQGGIAMVNVQNRIHLLFGEAYGIALQSALGAGTDVTITLPMFRDEQDTRVSL